MQAMLKVSCGVCGLGSIVMIIMSRWTRYAASLRCTWSLSFPSL